MPLAMLSDMCTVHNGLTTDLMYKWTSANTFQAS